MTHDTQALATLHNKYADFADWYIELLSTCLSCSQLALAATIVAGQLLSAWWQERRCVQRTSAQFAGHDMQMMSYKIAPAALLPLQSSFEMHQDSRSAAYKTNIILGNIFIEERSRHDS